MTGDSEKPSWWRENERLKQKMDLPKYEPPRFRDGIYTHKVLSELEEQYDCKIDFAGKNTRYLDDWDVRINNKPISSIGRRRDDNGNTVYMISSQSFAEMVTEILEDRTDCMI